ncbi:hypothetical protein L0P88_15175 [Muricauda sp. SCSIO 64092]|uniref:hypothetical protein n=1 Tax=Allomuricauda sp. SCSIO 64092 TaxID=2908842 RepID=UPI001FF49946|nr:hypothetical protein [Muricauda sp. SCSIO 64092]UOY05286.1 hypothetical protein L0P88_15175 [Muricauda sp. SCSIO 64092]
MKYHSENNTIFSHQENGYESFESFVLNNFVCFKVHKWEKGGHGLLPINNIFGKDIGDKKFTVTEGLGIKSRQQTSLTNSNIPIAKNVPAITLNRGGKGSSTHSWKESWANKEGAKNIKLTLLVLMAEAGLL